MLNADSTKARHNEVIMDELLEDIEDGSEGLKVNRHLYPADDNKEKVMFCA